METETLSKLYLELANIVPAGCLSHREIALRGEVEASHSREMALRACLLKNTPELEAEVERLQKELDDRTGAANVRMFDLKAEVERLRAALQAFMNEAHNQGTEAYYKAKATLGEQGKG